MTHEQSRAPHQSSSLTCAQPLWGSGTGTIR